VSINAYRFREGALVDTVDAADVADGDWVRVVAPNADDVARLAALGIPAGLLTHLDDPDERPRVRRLADCVLAVLHFPHAQAADAPVPYTTLPMSLIVTPRNIVTVAPERAAFLEDIASGEIDAGPPEDRARFVLQLMWELARSYLAALEQVEAEVDRLEGQLRRSLRNREVLGLLRHQKSLVYFTIALDGNELVLDRLHNARLVPWTAEDEDLLEDVRIELRQATEMVQIAGRILAEMMDAFASIVSNNLNSVMKVLTSATILLAIPTLVASLWGMNVLLPFAHAPWAFAALCVVCAAAAGLLGWVFRRRGWL
jgi:magnesium transporter